MAAAFSTALLHVSNHIQAGFLLAFTYFILRFGGVSRFLETRLRIVCGDQPVKLEHHNILLSVAPVPKTFLLSGFSLNEVIMVLRHEARIRLRLPEDVFMKSFKNREKLRLKGSLSTLVETVRESLAEGCSALGRAYWRTTHRGFKPCLREPRYGEDKPVDDAHS